MAMHLGSDSVTLIFREPVLGPDNEPMFDDDGRPVYTDRPVPKTGAKFTITGVTETNTVPPVAIYSAKCALEVDADSLALKTKDAIEFDGKVFEMSGDARPKRTLIDGALHHVRAFCSREERTLATGELITIAPRGGQDLDGRRLPDGAPFTVTAIAVDAGNTAERYGAEGTTREADFTVVLPLGSGVRDGDWVLVRGRRGLAFIQREFSQHAERNQDVVLVRSRTGGG